MNIKYIKLSRKCKNHTNLWSGAHSGCHYCMRALAHNLKLSPEESLLNDIFGESRFVRRIKTYCKTKKNPNYKGKRHLRNCP